MNNTLDHTPSGSIVDVILLIVLLLALWSGSRRGGIEAFFSLLGALLGITIGVSIMPSVIQGVTAQGRRFLAVVFLLSITLFIGYFIGQAVGSRLQKMVLGEHPPALFMRLNSILGAVCSLILAALLIWCVTIPYANNASYAATTNAPSGQAGEEPGSDIAGGVYNSRILHFINAHLPKPLHNLPIEATEVVRGSETGQVQGSDNTDFPVDPPNMDLEFSPVVDQVRPSIVRVLAQAPSCQRAIQGTGFVIDEDTILTNAHVLAGSSSAQISTNEGIFPVDVVFFDPNKDIALLKATNLGLPSLEWAPAPVDTGSDALIIGYPLDGAYQVDASRVRIRHTILTDNIYDNAEVYRESYILRSQVQQGNSGGPLLDPEGRVLGMVFGGSPNDPETSFALTKDEVLGTIGAARTWSEPQDTEACVASH